MQDPQLPAIRSRLRAIHYTVIRPVFSPTRAIYYLKKREADLSADLYLRNTHICVCNPLYVYVQSTRLSSDLYLAPLVQYII